MALNFQGDRAVGVLNDPKNTFNTDDLFRVYDGGILVAGGVSVDHGDFVSWDGTKWKLEADIKIVNTSTLNPESVPESASESNPLMTAEDTERMINAMKPIDAMTLRFEFSKKDYNPETADVGSSGTWTKVDSPNLNVWDWENTNTDWSNSFYKAFLDETNEVRVIAAGDTSSVTDMKNMFRGDTTGNASGSNYVVNAKNNIVSCVPLNIDSCNYLYCFFEGTHLKEFVQFDYSNNKDAECHAMYVETDIEEIGDIVISGKQIGTYFSHNSKLKKVGNITLDSPNFDTSKSLNIFANSSNFREQAALEEVGNITGTSVVTDFSTLFQNCSKLKKVGSIDVSGASVLQAMFSNCYELEEVPELIGLGNTNITNIYLLFSLCFKIKELPLFDTSHVINAKRAFRACYKITSIPDYDFSSITNAEQAFRDDYLVKTGITEAYDKLLARGAAITDHTDCFTNCGRDTPQGRAALAQIPQSWGGLAEG